MAYKKSAEGEKQSIDVTERVAAPPEGGEAKPDGAESKDVAAGDAGARATANDYWTTSYGGFHMSGGTGRAVYRYPAQANGGGYDTAWTFVDDLPVGGRQGWTYKENNFVFYMFFASQAENGKFRVSYSTNNQNFTFYAWAD